MCKILADVRLAGKTAVVTGAAAGNGRAIDIYEAERIGIDHLIFEPSVQRGDERRSTFHDWATNHVQGVQSVVYSETYRHSREPADGAWGRRPMYLVTYQVRAEMEQAFSGWYESDYIPRLMADAPGYAACRHYARRGSDPQTYLTVYEIASLSEVDASLADVGASWRTSENRAWHHWGEAAVPVIAANVFRLIFSRPV